MSVTVRTARADGAGAIAALLQALNSMDGPPPVVITADAVRRDLLGSAPEAMLLVAELGGTLVGLITANRVTDSVRAALALFLNDVFVERRARRRGVGRALVAGLAHLARRQSVACLWWGVDVGDDEAFAFYRAIDAVVEGVAHDHLLVGSAFDRLAGAAR